MREKKDRPIVRNTVGVIVIASLFILVSSFFYNLNADSYDFSHSELLIVPTDSMDGNPRDYEISTIPKDSMIMVHILSEGEKGDLKVGDVVTFYQDGIYKVHRIYKIDGETVITKGDATLVQDPPITMGDIRGKVIGVSAGMGVVISFVKGILSNIVLLIIIAILIIAVMIYEIKAVQCIMAEEE